MASSDCRIFPKETLVLQRPPFLLSFPVHAPPMGQGHGGEKFGLMVTSHHAHRSEGRPPPPQLSGPLKWTDSELPLDPLAKGWGLRLPIYYTGTPASSPGQAEHRASGMFISTGTWVRGA